MEGGLREAPIGEWARDRARAAICSERESVKGGYRGLQPWTKEGAATIRVRVRTCLQQGRQTASRSRVLLSGHLRYSGTSSMSLRPCIHACVVCGV